MKIGFEDKRVFHNTTGLGNYSRDLVRILHRYYPQNRYFLYNPKPSKNRLFESLGAQVIEKRPLGGFYSFFSNLWRRFGIINDLKRDQIELFHGLSGELPVGLDNVGIKSVVTRNDFFFTREIYSRCMMSHILFIVNCCLVSLNQIVAPHHCRLRPSG